MTNILETIKDKLRENAEYYEVHETIGTSTIKEYKIGFTIGRSNWHWFRLTYINTNHYIVFDHVYSQNNGRIKKHFKQRMASYKIFHKLTGIEI